jgi:hypothetical protein
MTSILIDDFTTGPMSRTLATAPTASLEYQGGASILGGARFTNLINAASPRNTPVTLDVASGSRLNLTLGVGQYSRLELGYGYTADGEQAPLAANLSDRKAFRTTFEAISGDFALNFNILAYLRNGWSIYGENLLGPAVGPVTIEYPLANFTGPGGTDFTDVSFLVFIIQTGDDVAINSLEAA